MRPKKKIKIEDLLKQADFYENRYRNSLEAARASATEQQTIDKLKIKTGYYSLRTRLKNNPWVHNRPASKAYSWLYKTVFADSKTYRYTKRLMYQGGMFIFEYKNPKYKGTSVLPWFDKYPLVISLGPKVTNLGVRNLGFNMHLLPPKIRLIVMCSIFELHKRMYRYQIFMKQDKPVMIDYRIIVKNLERFGVKFCLRMYIPERQRQIVRFPLKDWHKAIFIPSRGYDSIRSKQLVKEWRDFCRKSGTYVNPNLDWKSMI